MAKHVGKSMNVIKRELKHKEKTNHCSVRGRCMHNHINTAAELLC